MRVDCIETFHGCLIQHGEFNRRIYLMKWGPETSVDSIVYLETLAKQKGYTKIFAKIPEDAWVLFGQRGYRKEARIPHYFPDGRACLLLGKFFSKEREFESKKEEVDRILALAHEKSNKKTEGSIAPLYLKKAVLQDAEELSALYRTVFPSYPFPIDRPEYIRKTMETHVDYYLVYESSKIVAASSAEKDLDTKSVEMTDFATLPDYRSRGIANGLLQRMEKEMRKEGIRLFYTIARALSAGMNITFSKNGYSYAGTLTNNTFISGNIESMNVWYKQVTTDS